MLVAVLIGTIELLGLIGGKLSLGGPIWVVIVKLNGDLGYLRCTVIGLFVACWITSFTLYRWPGSE